MLRNRNGIVLALIVIFTSAAFAQKQYDGYSLIVAADASGICPVRWLPSSGGGNVIDVYIAGTNQQTSAGALKACGDSSVRGNQVSPNGYGKWCFTGPEDMYEIKLKNGVTYLWPSVTRETGFYNVKDFRPVTYFPQAAVKYQSSEPADYTKTIKNAIAYIAARQGGTLYFPDGDYIVGTLDGNRRDPNYDGITLPSGIIVQGTSSNFSVVNSDFPFKTGSTRIRLRNDKQTIFRIGGCTNQVTVRNLELVGNSELLGEAKRSSEGTYGIEAMGKWAVDPRTRAELGNSSQAFRFEELSLQNLDRAIYVHNANDDDNKCNPSEQLCNSWQFDYVKVDHVNFLNNKTGIWINTFNTDWTVTSSVFNYAATVNGPGDGIHIQRAGSMLIEQSFGGGYDYGAGIGGTFLNIDFVGSVTIINSGSERGQRSIYTNPAGAVSSTMINLIGTVFGDKIDLNGRLNFVSSGNFYGPKTIDAEPGVTITSVNDRYCYSPYVLPGRCVDESGRVVQSPGANGGRIMFETGHIGEEAGANTIQGKPNYFGYNVRIGDGLLQFDPNITFKDITGWAAGAGTRPRAEDGAIVYCKDCRKDNAGICTQGQAGTDGAFAKRINGRWRCD